LEGPVLIEIGCHGRVAEGEVVRRLTRVLLVRRIPDRVEEIGIVLALKTTVVPHRQEGTGEDTMIGQVTRLFRRLAARHEEDPGRDLPGVSLLSRRDSRHQAAEVLGMVVNGLLLLDRVEAPRPHGRSPEPWDRLDRLTAEAAIGEHPDPDPRLEPEP